MYNCVNKLFIQHFTFYTHNNIKHNSKGHDNAVSYPLSRALVSTRTAHGVGLTPQTLHGHVIILQHPQPHGLASDNVNMVISHSFTSLPGVGPLYKLFAGD